MSSARCKTKRGKSNKRDNVRHDNVHRWLISYADYMTLMFALFVVLYAMALVNEEPFEVITESLGKVFVSDKEKPLYKPKGDDILFVNSPTKEGMLHGDHIIVTKSDIPAESAQPRHILDSSVIATQESNLSKVTDEKEGEQLITVEEAFNSVLNELLINELVTIETKGDWLEIGLSSGLLFPSGSSSLMSSASPILNSISQVLVPINNFVRIRGYTDNQAINTEIFPSNWELSVYRATSVLKILEQLSINPSRMAIEGYGQYQPIATNSTSQGRAKNRRVVIAISKYGIQK